jgi:hypothetical protein
MVTHDSSILIGCGADGKDGVFEAVSQLAQYCLQYKWIMRASGIAKIAKDRRKLERSLQADFSIWSLWQFRRFWQFR